MKSCRITEGSHAKTFWAYSALAMVQKSGINSGFNLFDASSLLYADRYNGQYNMIYLVKSMVEPIVTALAGFLIVSSPIPNGKFIHPHVPNLSHLGLRISVLGPDEL